MPEPCLSSGIAPLQIGAYTILIKRPHHACPKFFFWACSLWLAMKPSLGRTIVHWAGIPITPRSGSSPTTTKSFRRTAAKTSKKHFANIITTRTRTALCLRLCEKSNSDESGKPTARAIEEIPVLISVVRYTVARVTLTTVRKVTKQTDTERTIKLVDGTKRTDQRYVE